MKLTPGARVRLTCMTESGGRRLLATYLGVTSTDHFSSRCSGRTSFSQCGLAEWAGAAMAGGLKHPLMREDLNVIQISVPGG